jgi:hypothetical protein
MNEAAITHAQAGMSRLLASPYTYPRARKKAAVKTPNVKPNQSASGISLRNPLEARRKRPWLEAK